MEPRNSTKLSTRLMYFGPFALVAVAYVLLTYFAPQAARNNSLQLSQMQITILKFTITLPYLITWTLAAYGFFALGQYTMSKHEKNEFTPVLRALHKGLAWIIFGMLATGLLGAVQPYVTSQPHVVPVLTIITNYLYVFPLLVGFWVMHRGIVSSLSGRNILGKQYGDKFIRTVIVLIIMAFYIFLIFTNPNRQIALDATTPATYYLSDLMIIFTLIIPVFATWWLGFSVAFIMSDLIPLMANAKFFKATTKILYGIWSIIFTSILLQALLSLGSKRLFSIGIGLLLLLVYTFLLLQGLGYGFLALGINKLKKLTTAGAEDNK